MSLGSKDLSNLIQDLARAIESHSDHQRVIDTIQKVHEHIHELFSMQDVHMIVVTINSVVSSMTYTKFSSNDQNIILLTLYDIFNHVFIDSNKRNNCKSSVENKRDAAGSVDEIATVLSLIDLQTLNQSIYNAIHCTIENIRRLNQKLRLVFDHSSKSLTPSIDVVDDIKFFVNSISFLAYLASTASNGSKDCQSVSKIDLSSGIRRYSMEYVNSVLSSLCTPIIQLIHSIFDRTLQPIHKIENHIRVISLSKEPTSESKSRRSLRPNVHASRPRESSESTISTTSLISPTLSLLVTDLLLRCSCLRLLGSIVSLSNPGACLGYWGLFTSESSSTERAKAQIIIDSIKQTQSAQNNLFVHSSVDIFGSPLFSSCCCMFPEVKVEALRCVKAMVANISLSLPKWLQMLPSYVQSVVSDRPSETSSRDYRSASAPSNRHHGMDISSVTPDSSTGKRKKIQAFRGLASDVTIGNLLKIVVVVFYHLQDSNCPIDCYQEIQSIVSMFLSGISLTLNGSISKSSTPECDSETIIKSFVQNILMRSIGVDRFHSSNGIKNSNQLIDALNAALNLSQSKDYFFLSDGLASVSTDHSKGSGKLKDALILKSLEWTHRTCGGTRKFDIIEKAMSDQVYAIISQETNYRDGSSDAHASYPIALSQQMNQRVNVITNGLPTSDLQSTWTRGSRLQNSRISREESPEVSITDIATASRDLFLLLCSRYPLSLVHESKYNWFKRLILSYCNARSTGEELTSATSSDQTVAEASNKYDWLFGLKVIAAILEKLRKYPNFHLQRVSQNDYLIPIGISTLELHTIMQKALRINIHHVLAMVVTILGKLPEEYYTLFRIDGSTDVDRLDLGDGRSFRVIDILNESCKHSVGTVRSTAYQSLGEVIALNSFSHLLEANDSTILTIIVDLLKQGCKDSKLAVRVQSMWALGNLLLVLLPKRHQWTSNNHQNDSALAGISLLISDASWIDICDLCLNCLEDSEKLLSSTIRSLGFLAAGLSIKDPQHEAYTSDIVNSIVRRSLLKTTEASNQSLVTEDLDYRLRQAIIKTNPNLLHTVSQTLGYVGWILTTRSDSENPNENINVSRNDDYISASTKYLKIVYTLRIVEAELLRFGNIKTQLQACRSLVLLTYQSLDQSKPYLDSELVGLFETMLVVLSSIDDFTLKPFTSSVEDAKRIQFCRVSLVLLWVLFKSIFDIRASNEFVNDDNSQLGTCLSILSYHLHDVIKFLSVFLIRSERTRPTIAEEIYRCGLQTIDKTELSLTSPPLLPTIPQLTFASACMEIVTYQDISVDIVRTILSLYENNYAKKLSITSADEELSMGRDDDSVLMSLVSDRDGWKHDGLFNSDQMVSLNKLMMVYTENHYNNERLQHQSVQSVNRAGTLGVRDDEF